MIQIKILIKIENYRKKPQNLYAFLLQITSITEKQENLFPLLLKNLLIKLRSNIGSKNKVQFWITHGILYEIEYLTFTFKICIIRKTSVIIVNSSKINDSDY